jgi:uncharacterized membrane protein
MYSKVKIAGHPLHPMLVVFPVTLYTTTLIGFVMYALRGDPFWWRFALGSNLAGIITAAVASVPGLIDWAKGIPKDTPAKATGRKHMLLNAVSWVLFTVNFLVHRSSWQSARLADANSLNFDSTLAIILTALGFMATLAAGFLGWSLVQTHHVGVELTDDQQRFENTKPMLEEQPGAQGFPARFK